MKIDGLIGLFRFNERFATWVSHLIVTFLMACLVVSLVEFVHRVTINWDLTYLIWLSVIVSVEAFLSHYRLYHVREDKPNVILYRGVEWTFIVILLKCVEYLNYGLDVLIQDVSHLSENFFETFFNAEFTVGVLILTVVWGLSTSFSDDLKNLNGDEIILSGTKLEAIIRDRGDSRQNIGIKVLIIGFAIIVLNALVRLDARIPSGELTFLSGRESMVSVILYFILALLLMSLTQFSNLRLSWAWDQIPIHQNIAKNWIVYGLIMFIVIGALAFILPTSYGLGFLPTIGYLISSVFYIIHYVLLILFIPFVFIFSVIQSLISDRPTTPITDVIPEAPEGFLPVNGSSLPWNDLIKSIVFWLFFIGIISFVLISYLSQNREFINKITSIPAIRWMLQAWTFMKLYLRKGVAVVPNIIQRTYNKLKVTIKSPPNGKEWRFLKVRKLNPRDQVFFWYLALIRRGREYGFPRRLDQTPYNYADTITSEISEVKDEMKLITETFIEARYSLHEITGEHAGIARLYWEKIKKKLNELRKVK